MEIDPSVLKRVPIRFSYDEGYFDDEYQVLPEKGYTYFFKNLLDHKNIKILLNTEALDVLKFDTDSKEIFFEGKPISIPVIYTGTIDTLLGNRYGQLPFRSLEFDYQTIKTDSFQDVSVVAYPEGKEYLRATEYKKMPVQNVPGITTVVFEYPVAARMEENYEPYYPVLTKDNAALYKQYQKELSKIPNLFLCGRLADYKYYNMDTAIVRAFEIFEKIQKNT